MFYTFSVLSWLQVVLNGYGCYLFTSYHQYSYTTVKVLVTSAVRTEYLSSDLSAGTLFFFLHVAAIYRAGCFICHIAIIGGLAENTNSNTIVFLVLKHFEETTQVYT